MTTADEILDRNGMTLPQGEQHRGQARIAYRLARRYADRLMYVHGMGWHAWDGTRWSEDYQGAAKRAVLDVLRQALADSLGDSDLRADVRKCESASGLSGVLDIAAVLEAFAVTVDDLDADPYLLNCANGTVDLRTMEVRGHDPADRITKVTRGSYRPGVTLEVWQRFLEQVLPEEEVRDYFHRFIGLSLLGKVREHVFAVATGTGANGKGTSYLAILNALGDYGHVAESDLFMSAKSNPNAASPALMGLLGKRFVVVSETERDHRLATALMKNLTGGDKITARALYGRQVTFTPSHTSLMVTNHLPKVAGDDPAAWRRIRVVPFDVVISQADQDDRLGEQLELAADEILSWALAGFELYQRDGLAAPDAVLAATDAYQHESDAMARFLDECCLINQHMWTTTADAYERWQSWAIGDGAEQMSRRAFGLALDRVGFPADPNRKRHRFGVGLAAAEAPE